jgi:hypothetical protein
MNPIKHNSKLWERKQDTDSYFLIWCSGCKCAHGFSVPRWSFDGNLESPTFAPSLRLSYIHPDTGVEAILCHINVTKGQIIYHSDCPHDLKGQTIPMQDIPENYGF